MSLVNPKPAGWGASDDLTSAQINVFGTEIVKALDKSTAGDTLSGVVVLASTGQIQLPFVSGILAEVPGAIEATATAGIQSKIAGGIGLAGGSTDWPAFYVPDTNTPAPRTRTLWVGGDRCRGISYNLGGSAAATVGLGVTNQPSIIDGTGGAGPYIIQGFFETAIVSSTSSRYAYYMPLDELHNGAVLSIASLFLLGASGHSALPANMPAFAIYRAGPGGVASLVSGTPYVVDSTSTVAAYKALHQVPLTTNQNNVIDTSQYSYFALIWDESGTDSEAFNIYYGIALEYAGIADMRFP